MVVWPVPARPVIPFGWASSPSASSAGVVGCEEHQIGHQRQQGGILLFGFSAHGCHPHAENDTEVVDEHHHPVVKQLTHQLQRSPLQHRQRLTQGLAGEQRPQHQQQARRRKIRQRRQQRL